jgi:hypothetical protein
MSRTKKSRQERRAKANAAAAPGWLKAGAIKAVSRSAKQKYEDAKLGTFGAASPVKRIDPAEYQVPKEASNDHDHS